MGGRGGEKEKGEGRSKEREQKTLGWGPISGACAAQIF